MRSGSGGTEGGWNGHADGLTDFPQCACDLAADHVALLVHRDRRLVQVIEISDDIRPLEAPAALCRLAGLVSENGSYVKGAALVSRRGL